MNKKKDETHQKRNQAIYELGKFFVAFQKIVSVSWRETKHLTLSVLS